MDNVYPFDEGAERAVIGSVMLEPTLFLKLSEMLSFDDFYNPDYREAWRLIGLCHKSGQIDFVTLEARRSENKSKLDLKCVLDAINATPTSEGSIRYAEIVEDCGTRRRMMKGLNDAFSKLSDRGCDIESVNRFVSQNIIVPNAEKSLTVTFDEAYKDFCEDYEKRIKRGSIIPGIPTGFSMLDITIGGLERGNFYVVGGRPGMGKTSFALSIAYQLAMNNNTVMIFSLEMSAKAILSRTCSIGAGVPAHKIRNLRLDDKDKKEMLRAKNYVGNRILINDKGFRTVESIQTECIAAEQSLKPQGRRVDCIIIDNLQLMNTNTRGADRRVQVGEISRGCKMLAGKLDCPVIIVSHLSRALKDRQDKRPVLTDLKESGDIEQDADAVIFLHRPNYYETERQPSYKSQEAEVIIAKNRFGEPGTLRYTWEPQLTRFSELPGMMQKPRGEGK